MAISYFAYEDLTVAGTALGFTAATYLNADKAFVLCETAAVRFRLDNGTPTATVGDTLEVGERLTLDSAAQIAGFKAIRRDGTSATLRCHFGVGND